MAEIKFRTLNPEDIEIRIGQKSDKMTMFLLYKNARVDMNILDETVGPDKWYRDHKELKGNLFCGVGIEVEPGKVVWKWDCGTESNTEKEKGEASDSFKRACVNWGIGRELYTTPRVRIWNNTLEFSGNYISTPLAVSEIKYDEARRITDLTIIDADSLEVKWKMKDGEIIVGVGARNAQKPAKVQLTGAHIKGGKANKIVQFLSAYDPDDFMNYNEGLKAVEEKYDITTDGYNALEFAVRAIRKAKTANA